MIKRNTKVLFNKVAPGSKSELARAGTCATERNRNHATKVSNPEYELWYRIAVQACKSKKLHHKEVTLSCAEYRNRVDLRSYDLRPLGRHVRNLSNRARGLAK